MERQEWFFVQIAPGIHQKSIPSSLVGEDEADLVRGAMALSKTRVDEVMVPCDRVYSLPSDATADAATLANVKRQGVGRVPLYRRGDPRDCGDYLLVRELVGVAAGSTVRLADVPGATFAALWTGEDHSLFELLNEFQTGSSHMAFVSKDPAASRARCDAGEALDGDARLLGIITLEDICEEILTEEIYDETDRQAAALKISSFVARKMKRLYASVSERRRQADPARAFKRLSSAPVGALSFMAKGAQARRALARNARRESEPAPLSPVDAPGPGRAQRAASVTSPLRESATWPSAGSTAAAPRPPGALDP